MRYFLLETCRPLGAWRRLAYRLPPRAHLASHRSRLTAAGYDYLAGEPFTSRRWTGRLWLAMLVPATRPTRVSLGPGPNPLNQESPPLSSRSRGHISAGHALSIRSLHPKTFIAPRPSFFLNLFVYDDCRTVPLMAFTASHKLATHLVLLRQSPREPLLVIHRRGDALCCSQS